MSKKDFQFIAEVINTTVWTLQGPKEDKAIRVRVAKAFCKALALKHPKFDPNRFYEACGTIDADS